MGKKGQRASVYVSQLCGDRKVQLLPRLKIENKKSVAKTDTDIFLCETAVKRLKGTTIPKIETMRSAEMIEIERFKTLSIRDREVQGIHSQMDSFKHIILCSGQIRNRAD